ncbi:MAG: PEGA domain-containing protein [Calditrichales bacterium]|nr:MAG: PEGA domain-containing protein [Calditrichales bacterium]
MEYVDGYDLRDIIDFSAPLPPFVAAMIIREVARGLEYTHHKSVIHRDIKPSNILISHLGEVKLIDFGVAKDETPSKLTVTGMIVGTPSYMSPEQANGDPIGPQSDVYAMGVLLFEMVTGVKPFLGDTNTEILMRIAKGKFPSPKKYNREMPWRLVQIIKKAMHRDIHKRYRNASEFIRDLDTFIPWRIQTNKKPVIMQFLRKYETDTLNSSENAFTPPRMYASSTRNFWYWTVIAAILFFIAAFQMHHYLKKERFVTMEVVTNVTQASVFLDGRLLGIMDETNQVFPNIVSGNHRLEIRGNFDEGVYQTNISLAAKKNAVINTRVPRRNTVVDILATSDPDSAAVYLDDILLGTTPLNDLRLKKGSHTITVRKNGFQTIIDRVDFEKNQSYHLHYRLPAATPFK